MRTLLLIIAIFSLSGCSTLNRMWQQGIAANDATLTASEAFLCSGASIGSIQRRYGNSEELAAAWRTLCVDSNEGVIIK